MTKYPNSISLRLFSKITPLQIIRINSITLVDMGVAKRCSTFQIQVKFWLTTRSKMNNPFLGFREVSVGRILRYYNIKRVCQSDSHKLVDNLPYLN